MRTSIFQRIRTHSRRTPRPGGHSAWVRALLLVTAALVLVTVGAGQAAAAPENGPVAPTTGGKQLPKGMPAELNQFVAGTDEFKNGPWFEGVCADKGGDFAGYLAAMFPNEEALRYWGLPADQKVKMIQAKAYSLVLSGVELPNGEKLPASALQDDKKAKEVIDAGWVPADDWYQETFPNDRSEFYPSTTPVCADDLKRWTSEAITTWGFKWAKQPDAASMDIMTAAEDGPRRTNAEAGDPQRNRIEDPCNTGEKRGWAYCEHAFFVNCDQAGDGRDRSSCLDWNTNVGKMFDETAAWIDRNTELSDRVDEAVKETGAYKLGAAAVDAFSMLWTGAVAIAKFVEDPSSVIDDWANTMKEGSIGLLQKVLPGLAEVGNFDFKAQWFIAWYAKAVGLGIAVLAVLFLAATVRAARSGGGRELLFNTLGYAPMAVAFMLFAPGVAYMIEAFCCGIVRCPRRLYGDIGRRAGQQCLGHPGRGQQRHPGRRNIDGTDRLWPAGDRGVRAVRGSVDAPDRHPVGLLRDGDRVRLLRLSADAQEGVADTDDPAVADAQCAAAVLHARAAQRPAQRRSQKLDRRHRGTAIPRHAHADGTGVRRHRSRAVLDAQMGTSLA
ncbi:hypothetical protein [Williamsia muralis]|uniref:hypothetical protein n=1 Tax=Williamsia marianensis TaxID=85044 RepID=UPI001057A502|nr:hypothetical protein [Williamsia marianensis]